MTDEYSSEQPEESALPLDPHAETTQYGPAAGSNASVPIPVAKPFYRRTGVLLGAAAVAVAVVAAGVGLALSQSSSSSTASSTPGSAPAQTGNDASGIASHRHAHAIVGTIASENGETWTINRTDGTTATVTITPQTRFGTRTNQETQSQFVVGNQVAIRGKDADGVVTARWVGNPQDLQHHRAGAAADPDAQIPDAGRPN